MADKQLKYLSLLSHKIAPQLEKNYYSNTSSYEFFYYFASDSLASDLSKKDAETLIISARGTPEQPNSGIVKFPSSSEWENLKTLLICGSNLTLQIPKSIPKLNRMAFLGVKVLPSNIKELSGKCPVQRLEFDDRGGSFEKDLDLLPFPELHTVCINYSFSLDTHSRPLRIGLPQKEGKFHVLIRNFSNTVRVVKISIAFPSLLEELYLHGQGNVRFEFPSVHELRFLRKLMCPNPVYYPPSHPAFQSREKPKTECYLPRAHDDTSFDGLPCNVSYEEAQSIFKELGEPWLLDCLPPDTKHKGLPYMFHVTF